VVDEDTLRKIFRRLADLAEQGNLDAVKLLFDYALGKPGVAPDPDLLDLQDWQLHDAQPTVPEILRGLLDNVSFPSALEAAQLHREDTFNQRLKMDGRTVPTQEVMALRDKRSGRKRSAATPPGG
jgi:hypothetical protein